MSPNVTFLRLCRYNHITTHFSAFLSLLKWPPAIPAFPPVSLPCRRTTCSSLCCGSSSRCSRCSRCCGNPLRKNTTSNQCLPIRDAFYSSPRPLLGFSNTYFPFVFVARLSTCGTTSNVLRFAFLPSLHICMPGYLSKQPR